jgi:hypothetical protein
MTNSFNSITTISDTWKKDKEAGIGLILSKGFVKKWR